MAPPRRWHTDAEGRTNTVAEDEAHLGVTIAVNTSRVCSSGKFVINPRRTVLLVIDMCNLFVGEAGAEVLKRAIGPTNAVAKALRAAGGSVIWSNWGLEKGAPDVPPSTAAIMGGALDLLHLGSDGVQTVKEMDVDPSDRTVSKCRYGAFTGTPLAASLHSAGVHTVIVAGVLTNACVLYTITEAHALGFDVILCTDATAHVAAGAHVDTFVTEMAAGFGAATKSEALVAGLSEKSL